MVVAAISLRPRLPEIKTEAMVEWRRIARARVEGPDARKSNVVTIELKRRLANGIELPWSAVPNPKNGTMAQWPAGQ